MRVFFCFHDDLKNLLPCVRRSGQFEHPAGATDTVKHVIESLGVPHTEVARVLINGAVSDLSQRLRDGDRIDVFPTFGPEPVDDARFVLDGHLGRLAAYLRMLGFDVWYEQVADDIRLAFVCSSESRILLTRDIGLLKRKEVQRGYFVRADRPHDQLREIARRFLLLPHIRPFTRCMTCNGLLERVSKQEVVERLPPHTRATKDEFSLCSACAKVYWKGSHHARMLQWITDLTTTTGPK